MLITVVDALQNKKNLPFWKLFIKIVIQTYECRYSTEPFTNYLKNTRLLFLA